MGAGWPARRAARACSDAGAQARVAVVDLCAEQVRPRAHVPAVRLVLRRPDRCAALLQRLRALPGTVQSLHRCARDLRRASAERQAAADLRGRHAAARLRPRARRCARVRAGAGVRRRRRQGGERRKRQQLHGLRDRRAARAGDGQGRDRAADRRQVPGWRHSPLLRGHLAGGGHPGLPAAGRARRRAGPAGGMAGGPGGDRPRRRSHRRAEREGADPMIRDKVTLISGAAGFVGTNLAHRLLSDGERVRVLDDLSRPGVERNLEWLEREHGSRLQVEVSDVCDTALVARAMSGARSAYHFAAQVAVTTSLDDPRHDASVNLLGTLNLLEAARAARTPVPLVFTSTNKVYGDLADVALRETDDRHEPIDRKLRSCGISEARHLEFCTPYGCSKGAADQYVLDWHKSFGVPTAVFRMSCIYGPHQFGNEDQGWVAHFLISALAGEPITIYGDGRQARDTLSVHALVDALLAARANIGSIAGRAFNIGGGPRNAISLRDVTALIEELTGTRPKLTFGDWRKGDQRWDVSDPAAFGAATGWQPRVAPREGISELHDWLVAAQRETVAEAA